MSHRHAIMLAVDRGKQNVNFTVQMLTFMVAVSDSFLTLNFSGLHMLPQNCGLPGTRLGGCAPHDPSLDCRCFAPSLDFYFLCFIIPLLCFVDFVSCVSCSTTFCWHFHVRRHLPPASRRRQLCSTWHTTFSENCPMSTTWKWYTTPLVHSNVFVTIDFFCQSSRIRILHLVSFKYAFYVL